MGTHSYTGHDMSMENSRHGRQCSRGVFSIETHLPSWQFLAERRDPGNPSLVATQNGTGEHGSNQTIYP
jgi:hypothetical protein